MNILITGTSSGLGLALKTEYLKRKANVIDFNRNTCDLSDIKKIHKKIKHLTQDTFIDYVYLNAGMLGKLKKIVDVTIEEMAEVITVNALSSKIILDYLLINNKVGNVISISSGAAIKGYYGWSSYCGSKALMKQLISCYALEHTSVRFVSLAPGIMKTKMQDEIYAYDAAKIPSVKKFKEMYRKMDTPEHVAKKILCNIQDILTQDNPNHYFDMRNIQDG